MKVNLEHGARCGEPSMKAFLLGEVVTAMKELRERLANGDTAVLNEFFEMFCMQPLPTATPVQVDLPNVVQTAPAEIYLCLGDDDEVLQARFSELAEVTWSWRPATVHSVEYIRADRAAIAQATVKESLIAGSTEQDERAAFEAQEAAKGCSDFERWPWSGGYKLIGLEDRWQVWQARAALAQQGEDARWLDDRRIADTVNTLRDIAKQYGQTQQLRERIASVVVPLLKGQVDSLELIVGAALAGKGE